MIGQTGRAHGRICEGKSRPTSWGTTRPLALRTASTVSVNSMAKSDDETAICRSGVRLSRKQSEERAGSRKGIILELALELAVVLILLADGATVASPATPNWQADRQAGGEERSVVPALTLCTPDVVKFMANARQTTNADPCTMYLRVRTRRRRKLT